MIVKSRARRHGTQLGIQKHKIKSCPVGAKSILRLVENLIPDGNLCRFYELAEKSYLFYAKSCCKLALFPLSVRADGKLEAASGTKLHFHYAVATVYILSMLHKFVVGVYRVLYAELDVNTFLSVDVFLVLFIPFALSVSGLFHKEVTVDLLNGWDSILSCYPESDGTVLSAIQNTKVATLVIALTILTGFVGVAIAGFSIILDSLPFCYCTMAEAVGLIPEDSGIPRIVWKLAFWPLEMLTYVPAALIAGWSSMMLMTMVVVIKTCTDQLRWIFLSSYSNPQLLF